MSLPAFKEFRTEKVTDGRKYDSSVKIIAEGTNLPGIVYAETGSFLVARLRADGEWGNGHFF